MTGVLQVVAGGESNASVVAWTASLSDTKTAANASASITLNADGTVTVLGSNSRTSGAWYRPTGGTPGTSYWMKLTQNSGTPPSTGPAAGGMTPMSGSTGWSWTQTVLGLRSANVTVDVYDNVAGSGSPLTTTVIAVAVERQ